MNPSPLGSGILAGKSSFPSTWPKFDDAQSLLSKSFPSTTRSLGYKPTLCYDTSSGKQRWVALAPNDLPWVMPDVMTSWTLQNTGQLTQGQQSISVCQ